MPKGIRKTKAVGVVQGDQFVFEHLSFPINPAPNSYVPKDVPFVMDAEDKGFFIEILASLKAGKDVLLVGPTGAGKSSTIRFLARATNNGYRRVQITGGTTTDHLIGRWLINDKGTYWQDGILIEAMKEGSWIILDEINMAAAEIMAILHSIMDDERSLVLQEKNNEKVEAHPNFRILACINPWEDYAGTKEMNLATKGRFVVINYDYPKPKKEKKIMLAHSTLTPEIGTEGGRKGFIDRMLEVAAAVRQEIKDRNISTTPMSTRQLIQWAQLTFDMGVKTAGIVALANQAEGSDRNKIIDQIDKMFADEENLPVVQLLAIKAEAERKKWQEQLDKATEKLTQIDQTPVDTLAIPTEAVMGAQGQIIASTNIEQKSIPVEEPMPQEDAEEPLF